MNAFELYALLMLPGSPVGQLVALDADEEGTLNAQLTYSIVSSNPETFSIDATSGNIQTLRTLQRKDKKEYSLNIRVSDPGNALTA